MLHTFKKMNNSTAYNISPFHEAHRSYLVDVDTTHCHYLMELDWSEMCSFVQKNPKCSELQWHINWMEFMFCDIRMDNATFITMIALMIGIIFIFSLSLIIVSYIRLAPCFIATCHYMRFDEHTAGAVLLLLISYAGDVIENAQLYTIDTTTAFNEALGATMMTLGLIGGLLTINYQFSVLPSYIVRDTIFVVFGLQIATIVYIHTEMYFHFALVFMAVYVLFLISVLVEFAVAQAAYRQKYKSFSDAGLEFAFKDMIPDHRPITLKFEINDSLQYGELEKANQFLFKQFVETINPVRLGILKTMNPFYKSCFIIGIPMHMIIILCIPCFDYTLPSHGWSKLMTCVNLICVGPVVTMLFTLDPKFYIYTWIPGFILSIVVFFTSRTDRPPKYHLALSFLSLAICGCIQFMLERELMSILHMIGTFCRLRRETTALCFLAWADNLGLVVWIFRLAEWGYPKIGFSALYCAPLIDMIYSLGLMFTVKLWMQWKTHLIAFEGEMGPTSACYSIVLYGFVFFGISLCKFQVRKSLGIACLIIYTVYIIQILMVQLELIHGLGTDHTSTVEKVVDVVWA